MTFRRTPVRVRVPASSANLGPGFDSFGLALSLYDDLVAEVTPAGLHVMVTGEGAATVGSGEQHLVVRAMRVGFERIGQRPGGIALRCTNGIPHGRGLGSSAAAVVAGLMLARALVDEAALSDQDILALATEMEGHPDNVAACLFGGFTIAWTVEGVPDALRLDPADGLGAVLFVPEEAVFTAHARTLLPASVPHADAAYNAARAGLLVAALTRRTDLLLAATDDRLHQGYREPAMPATAALVRDLRRCGTPAVVSGAGPAVLALAPAEGAPRLVGRAGAGWTALALAVEPGGARVSTDARGVPESGTQRGRVVLR